MRSFGGCNSYSFGGLYSMENRDIGRPYVQVEYQKHWSHNDVAEHLRRLLSCSYISYSL